MSHLYLPIATYMSHLYLPIPTYECKLLQIHFVSPKKKSHRGGFELKPGTVVAVPTTT